MILILLNFSCQFYILKKHYWSLYMPRTNSTPVKCCLLIGHEKIKDSQTEPMIDYFAILRKFLEN